MARKFIDVEGPVRTWLRAHPDLASTFGARFFFGTPRGGTSVPWVTLSQASGIANPYTPEFLPLFQFSIWGNLKDRQVTQQAAYVLASVLETANEKTPMNLDGLILYGVIVTTWPMWAPDPDNDRARYLIQARLTVVARDQKAAS